MSYSLESKFEENSQAMICLKFRDAASIAKTCGVELTPAKIDAASAAIIREMPDFLKLSERAVDNLTIDIQNRILDSLTKGDVDGVVQTAQRIAKYSEPIPVV